MTHNVEVFPDQDAVAEAAAIFIAQQARRAIADHGEFILAMTGGPAALAMLYWLRSEQLPWEKVRVFQVEERVTSLGDPARHLPDLRGAFAYLPVEIFAMPVEDPDIYAAAASYALLLPDQFDVLLVGLGHDGHRPLPMTDPRCWRQDENVVVIDVLDDREPTMSLTSLNFAKARQLVWLITGADGGQALRRLLDGDAANPVDRAWTLLSFVLADQAAMARTRTPVAKPAHENLRSLELRSTDGPATKRATSHRSTSTVPIDAGQVAPDMCETDSKP